LRLTTTTILPTTVRAPNGVWEAGRKKRVGQGQDESDEAWPSTARDGRYALQPDYTFDHTGKTVKRSQRKDGMSSKGMGQRGGDKGKKYDAPGKKSNVRTVRHVADHKKRSRKPS